MELISIRPLQGNDEVSVLAWLGAVAMMNGCLISIIIVGKAFSDSIGIYLQETGPHPGQNNVNVFLKKPMPLFPNAILKKSTRCLIMCNTHVRVAIRGSGYDEWMYLIYIIIVGKALSHLEAYTCTSKKQAPSRPKQCKRFSQEANASHPKFSS